MATLNWGSRGRKVVKRKGIAVGEEGRGVIIHGRNLLKRRLVVSLWDFGLES